MTDDDLHVAGEVKRGRGRPRGVHGVRLWRLHTDVLAAALFELRREIDSEQLRDATACARLANEMVAYETTELAQPFGVRAVKRWTLTLEESATRATQKRLTHATVLPPRQARERHEGIGILREIFRAPNAGEAAAWGAQLSARGWPEVVVHRILERAAIVRTRERRRAPAIIFSVSQSQPLRFLSAMKSPRTDGFAMSLFNPSMMETATRLAAVTRNMDDLFGSLARNAMLFPVFQTTPFDRMFRNAAPLIAQMEPFRRGSPSTTAAFRHLAASPLFAAPSSAPLPKPEIEKVTGPW
ncbi:MAG TPA: hypothetical protein VGG10_15040 [Rhizomicrobium sp.]|jgi:hypothetical protein